MIKNVSNGCVLARNERVLRSWFGHASGLMFRRVVPVVLEFRKERFVSLHSFFVRGFLDILFVDAEGRVVVIKERMMPFSLFFSRNKAKSVIELPAGIVKKTKIRVGDIVEYT